MLTIDDVIHCNSYDVKVELQNGKILGGFFASSIPPTISGSWLFCESKNKEKYSETNDQLLLLTILHKDIKRIELLFSPLEGSGY